MELTKADKKTKAILRKYATFLLNSMASIKDMTGKPVSYHGYATKVFSLILSNISYLITEDIVGMTDKMWRVYHGKDREFIRITITDSDRWDRIIAGLTLVKANSKASVNSGATIKMGWKMIEEALMVDGEVVIPVKLEPWVEE